MSLALTQRSRLDRVKQALGDRSSFDLTVKGARERERACLLKGPKLPRVRLWVAKCFGTPDGVGSFHVIRRRTAPDMLPPHRAVRLLSMNTSPVGPTTVQAPRAGASGAGTAMIA